MYKYLRYGIISIYILIAIFHLYIVKEILILVITVLAFEGLRIIAVLAKLRMILIILAVLSSAFLISNYYSYYKTNKINNEQNSQIANNISKYTGKYWTNQDKFIDLIHTQQSSTKEVKNIPDFYFMAIFILAVEGVLAYVAIVIREPIRIKRKYTKRKANSE